MITRLKEFEPTDFPDLLFWYDLSQSSTVTTDAFGITQVDDLSGNDYHMGQITDARKPDYANTLNGLNVATFTGGGSGPYLYHDLSSQISDVGSLSFFLVGQIIARDLSSYESIFSTDGGEDWQVQVSNIQLTLNRGSSSSAVFADLNDPSNLQPALLEIHYDHDAITTKTYMNGSLHDTVSNDDWSAGGPDWDIIKLGSNRNSSGTGNCHIGECFAYSSNIRWNGKGNSLWGAQRQRMADSLMAKWGLS